jgi:hypothetical protein
MSGLAMDLDSMKALLAKAEKLNEMYQKQRKRNNAAVRRYYAKNVEAERERRKVYYQEVVKPRNEAKKQLENKTNS